VTRRPLPLLLAGFVASQWILAATAWASGYEVVFEKSYRSKDATYARVHSLIKARDGGYAFTGWGHARDPWLVKTDASGKKEWEVLIPGSRGSDSDAFVVLNAPDGGYLLGGRSNSHDLVPGDWKGDGTPKRPYGYRYTPIVAFAVRFDQGGHLLWRKAYGRLGNVRSAADFTCGKALSDGFFMVGRKTVEIPVPATMVPYYPYLSVLWVVKLSLDGEILWQKVVKEDGDDLLSPTVQYYCAPTIVESPGRVTFAATLVKRTPGGPYVKYPHHLALVMSFSPSGRELARRRIDDASSVQVRETKKGVVVLDNPLHEPPRGIRRTELDRDLNLVGQSETKFKDFMFWLAGASPLGEEGFYITGKYVVPPHERGKPAIATFDSKGRLENLKTFGLLYSDWGEPQALTRGSGDNEIVLLRQGGTSEDVGLVALRLTR
jgi:hypothetical protein